MANEQRTREDKGGQDRQAKDQKSKTDKGGQQRGDDKGRRTQKDRERGQQGRKP